MTVYLEFSRILPYTGGELIYVRSRLYMEGIRD